MGGGQEGWSGGEMGVGFGGCESGGRDTRGVGEEGDGGRGDRWHGLRGWGSLLSPPAFGFSGVQ